MNPGARNSLGGNRYLWVLLLALAAALAIYGQTVSFGYAGYDDSIITREGEQIERGLSSGSIKRILTPRGLMTYQPLRDLAVEAVYEFWATEPAGYHWFNLLMFLANLAAVFWLLQRLLGLFTTAWPGGIRSWAAAGTVWFAVHPIHVEAVAWMNSNKELLSGLFYFLALGLYLDSRGRGGFSFRYLASWICFLLGLAAKPSGAAFPLVLAALEMIVPDRKEPVRESVLRVAPFLLLASVAGLFVLLRSSTGTWSWLQGSALTHLLSMVSVLGRYIIGMLLPVNLCHSYPPPFFFGAYDWRLGLYLILDLGLAAGAWLSYRRGARLVSFGIIFFLLNLLPVSGIIPIAVFRADRYMYIPSLGLIITGLALLRPLASEVYSRRILVAIFSLVLVLLAAMAHSRCSEWRDSLSLWKSSVRTHGNFQYNHYGLGLAYISRGMNTEALKAMRNANRFQDNFMCHYWTGRVFARLGEPDSSRAHLEKAASMFTPDLIGQMVEMADIYRRLGETGKLADHLASWGGTLLGDREFILDTAVELAQLDENGRSLELLKKAGDKQQDRSGFFLEAARRMQARGEAAAAASVLELAGQYASDPVETSLLSADAAFAAGQWERAVEQYSAAGIDRLDANRMERLAAAHLRRGRPAKALELFRTLAGDSPGPAQLNNIGAVLEAMDSLGAAQRYFNAAVELDSSYADGWFNLGRVRSRMGRLEPALECYIRASTLEEKNLDSKLAVARIQAQLGLIADAEKTYNELLQRAPDNMNLLLETADFAWSVGKKDAAGEYYGRLADTIPPEQLPSRVNTRRK